MVAKQVKGMAGMTVGAVLGSTAMQAVGNAAGSLGSGISSATQSLIGVGVIGHAAKTTKNSFKWMK